MKDKKPSERIVELRRGQEKIIDKRLPDLSPTLKTITSLSFAIMDYLDEQHLKVKKKK